MPTVRPIVSWYEGTNETSKEITGSHTVNYGTVDADDESVQKTFFIWNNRNGDIDVPKMEEVTFATKDRLGGTGDTQGQEVPSVRDNWFRVRVDSLNEQAFTAVGKDHAHSMGTNGSTTNPNSSTAEEWSASKVVAVGDYIKPTGGGSYIYRVTQGGTTGGTEPIWASTVGDVTTEGNIEYATVRITVSPAAQEILGLQNSVLPDGSNASNSAGNFAKITVFARVPASASAGRQLLLQRVSYRYIS